jgi:hypothetical protein
VRQTKLDPLKPSIAVLVKLGSIAIHAEELTEPGGHAFDKVAMDQLLKDGEVKAWINAMGAMLPLKRGGQAVRVGCACYATDG